MNSETRWTLEYTDLTHDPRIVEVTAPPAAKPSKFAIWFARVFWLAMFLMLAEDVRLWWWAWVLGR